MQSIHRSGAEPRLRHVDVEGLRLAAFEWRADLNDQGPTLLLVHATSFHGRVWDQMLRHLPPMHAIALELRGHGRSANAPFESWRDHCWDVAGAVAKLGLRDAVGIGHSMGGHALVRAASFDPGRFGQLILIDPSLFAPGTYLKRHVSSAAASSATRRKRHFASPQAMLERLATRVPYSTFDPAALRDYCEHGLVPVADGSGFELACSPETEAKVYSLAHEDAGVYASIRALHAPVAVIRARTLDPTILPFDTLGSPTWEGLAAEFRFGRDIHLPQRTHLMVMEDPAGTAAVVREIMTTAGY